MGCFRESKDARRGVLFKTKQARPLRTLIVWYSYLSGDAWQRLLPRKISTLSVPVLRGNTFQAIWERASGFSRSASGILHETS